MHNGAARSFPFFMDSNPILLTQIVPFLIPLFVSQSDTIYDFGDYAEEIYFVYQGRAGLAIRDQDIVYKTYVNGSYFGEIELIETIPRIDKAIAISVGLEMFTLHRTLYKEVFPNFPEAML
jgi:hyperpolarization activated cyclic nucleotide-gated potassium channel 1